MKNKSTTYVLIAGVLLVWGFVFYRIFSGLDSDKGDAFNLPIKENVAANVVQEEQTFILFANYRDPFLGSFTAPSNSINNIGGNNATIKNNTAKKTVTKKEPAVQINWDFIDYIGIVYNKETKKNVGLLVISGKEYMANDNDVINNVKILKKERDSIQVEYSDIKIWIKR